MKHLSLCLILLILAFSSFAQNTGIGIGTTNPDPSAQLDVSSSNKGFLPPRMTGAQRATISNPTPGLIVWCIDCGTGGELSFFDGYEWKAAAVAGPSFVFTAPILTTSPVTTFTLSSAIFGGTIISDGGTEVTARGICWSTSHNPTISLSTKTTDGTGIGSFTRGITGLNANSTYYVRAYATNNVGTSYGSEVSFTTTSTSFENLPNVLIGSQIWTTTNLNVSKYRNGDLIPKVTSGTQWASLTSGAYCWYNNDSTTYASTYGRLYNWYSVNDSRGLAPKGWHVPSDAEWNKLTKFLDPNADTTMFSSSNIAGIALKSTSGWYSGGNGTNTSGFSGLPGGCRYDDGTFSFINMKGWWWSSSMYPPDSTSSMYRNIFYAYDYILSSGYKNTWGFSIRLIRD